MKQKPLEERITELRAEIDAFIEARVDDLAKSITTVPRAALRKDLVGYSGGCKCDALLSIVKQEKAA